MVDRIITGVYKSVVKLPTHQLTRVKKLSEFVWIERRGLIPDRIKFLIPSALADKQNSRVRRISYPVDTETRE
jgi:hypothetical protein